MNGTLRLLQIALDHNQKVYEEAQAEPLLVVQPQLPTKTRARLPGQSLSSYTWQMYLDNCTGSRRGSLHRTRGR